MSKKKIFICEDSPDIVEIYQHCLDTLLGDNMELDIAINGSKALEYLQSKKYEYAIIDILMPNFNGFDVITILQLDGHMDDTKSIVISGYLSDNVKAALTNLKVTNFLEKPFDNNTLEAKFKEFLDL